MSNNSQELVNIVNTFTSESEKFWNGNNSAGTRARKSLQEVIKYARSERKRIQEEKNNRKTKNA